MARIQSTMLDDRSSTSRERSFEDNEVTGLRSKRLVALLICLSVIFIVSLLLLALNLMIISTLQMNGNGMKFLRFHQSYNKQTDQMEKTVEMSGSKVELGKVVSNGLVVGFPEKDILIHAPRITVSSKPNDSRFVMDGNTCKFENTNSFQIVDSSGKTVFSARHPTITIDKKIKKISATKIITDKIRSGVDEDLKIQTDDVTIRGNEALRLDARRIDISGGTRVAFNTSRDGSIHLRGGVRLGSGTAALPVSSSPALSASLDAMRVCACVHNKHQLFLVAANRPCQASQFC
ncbi:unnamed protein product [Caenorhabditis auriculariae]|uniref:Beta-sarcoglycan n=1 Tax=Caenorhabditis auriculariae TaxID=2777116 RepID=A0A8S1GZB8_9PELO|nr:unnamed protein product [Caenorhabditis auriculariae]